jgi:hypothetical protein
VQKFYSENKKEERAKFKATLTTYNKAIRRLKRKSFVRFSEEILETSAAAGLRKILSKDHTNGLGSLRRVDRTLTGDQKEITLEILMRTQFSESQRVNTSSMTGSDDLKGMDSNRQITWRASEGLIDGKKVKWAINNLKPYKSPGPDQIGITPEWH